MHHPADLLSLMGPHDVQGVLRRIPAVDNHGQGKVSCQLQLFLKPGKLPLFFREAFFVIIQADLAEGHHLRMGQGLSYHMEILRRPSFQIFRVHPGGAVHPVVLVNQCNGRPDPLGGASDVYHMVDAAVRKGREHLPAVPIERCLIVVCMRIKYHQLISAPA